jgi:glutaconate CoA-transferase subunit A
MSASEAVARFVDEGDSVYVGYTSVSFGLAYEIIRQGKRNLELLGGSVGIQGTIMTLAGCADRVSSGYIGGALRPGLTTEMMDDGRLRFEDYSNQAIALMLMAGALGIPFIPTRSFLGTDYLKPEYQEHPGGYLGAKKWAQMESPFDGEKVVLLPALRPDVAIIPAQRADEDGNVQAWGHQGDARWAYWAAKKVIVTVEEIVPREVVRADPGRTVVPGFRVAAVVHMPYSAHPSGMAGYYDTDYFFQSRVFGGMMRDRARFEAFAAEWVHGCPDRTAYLAHYREVFGARALDAIAATEGPSPADGIRYPYAPELRFR